MNSKFLKNTSWLIIGHIVQMILQFVVGTLSARYLGPSNYGIISYVASYTNFFSSLCVLGLNSVIINTLVKYKDKEGTIINTCINLRLIVSVVSSIIMVVLISIIDKGDKEYIIVACLQAVQLPFTAFNTINYWYQSKLQSKHAVIAMNISYLVTAAYKIFLLATKQSVYWFAFATSLDIIILAIFYIFGYQKKRSRDTESLYWSKDMVQYLLKKSSPFIVAGVMIQIYQQTDKIMLKIMLDSTSAVGIYTAVTTICTIIGFIPTAILDSARPVVMELKNKSENKYLLRMRQLFGVLIWGDVLYACMITIFADIVMYILYGQEYMGGVTALRIAVWYTAFSYLGSARSTWLICEEKNRYAMIFSVMGALTNIVLNYILIPTFGINGAAVATLMTQCLNNFIYPVFFSETRAYFILVLEALTLRKMNIRSEIKLIMNKKVR